MNDLPVRRSCPGVPHALTEAALPRSPPASTRSLLVALHILDSHMHPVLVPGAHADPASRWASAACAPAAHSWPVPCTPVTAQLDMCAASGSAPLLPPPGVPASYASPFLAPPPTQPQPHRPPDASPRLHLRALLPPLPALADDPIAAL